MMIAKICDKENRQYKSRACVTDSIRLTYTKDTERGQNMN